VPPAGHAETSRETRAAALFASAKGRLARGTHELRQFALTELQTATALDPSRSDIAIALGTLTSSSTS